MTAAFLQRVIGAGRRGHIRLQSDHPERRSDRLRLWLHPTLLMVTPASCSMASPYCRRLRLPTLPSMNTWTHDCCLLLLCRTPTAFQQPRRLARRELFDPSKAKIFDVVHPQLNSSCISSRLEGCMTTSEFSPVLDVLTFHTSPLSSLFVLDFTALFSFSTISMVRMCDGGT